MRSWDGNLSPGPSQHEQLLGRDWILLDSACAVLFQVLLIISQIKWLLRKGIWFIGRMFQEGFIALEYYPADQISITEWRETQVASLALSRPALPVAQGLKWTWYENALFYSHVALFSWRKTLPQKNFFLLSGTVKFTCPSCVCRYWYSQVCEFPLHFTSSFHGSLKPKHKIFSKSLFSLVGKASPTPLTSRCHPLSFEPVTKLSWFLDWSFQRRLPFSHVASNQFSSGNTVVLFKALF